MVSEEREKTAKSWIGPGQDSESRALMATGLKRWRVGNGKALTRETALPLLNGSHR